jgi:threonine aldolase
MKPASMATTRSIDLRSDTVTRPTPAMRRAIADAEVGDDVIEVDPSIDRLERMIAERLGKEAALFMPSGTMTNQVAVRIHCQPGDELVCEEFSHLFNKQQGGFAQLSGIVARTVRGERGVMEVSDLRETIRTENEHHTRTRLLCLENTHNRWGGTIHPLDALQAATQWAREAGLRTHLDGARLFNAEVATGIDAAIWAEPFDTISICFSKGLGAPVGSALVGPRDLMPLAIRHRKLFGGAMRQAGIIAAAASYALEHHVDRLAEDHEHARILGESVGKAPGLELISGDIDTNIVIFSVQATGRTANEFVQALQTQGVLMGAVGADEVRAVTHLDVSREDITRAAAIVQQVAEQWAEAPHPVA